MRSRLNSLITFTSIRKKMLIYFIIAEVLIGFTSIYTFFMSKSFIHQMDSMFISGIMLDRLEDTLNSAESNLLSYLTTKQSDSLNNYVYYSEELQQKSQEMKKRISYDETDLLLKDIANMIESYLEEANEAVMAKRGRYINEYIQRYREGNTLAKYIKEYIYKLKENQLNMNTQFYSTLSEKIRILQVSSVVMIASTIILSILIVIQITYKITHPITKLSHSANELSKGNFEIEEIDVETNDELKVLADAFNKMKYNIGLYIEELKLKAQMEAKLMDEEMKNLRMKNLLDNAELQALQSQINPHFLFNTLNAGVQLAMMEGADRTSEFLENMSSLFRYNIKKLDKPVILKEEVENIKAYYDLLKVRFGSMIDMEYEIEEEALSLQMPPLILQPIVENAIIHGIGDFEYGGKVKITIQKRGKMVRIVVEDNGKGMDSKTIEKIYSRTSEKISKVSLKKSKKGHTTGIGLSNVIHRLNLFYNDENLIEIESVIGKGTRIILYLPEQYQEGSDV